MKLMSRYEDNYFDLAIVDPPYGANDAIGLKDNKGCKKQATKRTGYKVFKNVEPSTKVLIATVDEVSKVCAVLELLLVKNCVIFPLTTLLFKL